MSFFSELKECARGKKQNSTEKRFSYSKPVAGASKESVPVLNWSKGVNRKSKKNPKYDMAARSAPDIGELRGEIHEKMRKHRKV